MDNHPQEHDLETILRTLQYDLTALKARVSEAQRLTASLNLTPPNRARCPHCDLTFKGPRTLAEHTYHQHNGPEPDHWQQAETTAETSP